MGDHKNLLVWRFAVLVLMHLVHGSAGTNSICSILDVSPANVLPSFQDAPVKVHGTNFTWTLGKIGIGLKVVEANGTVNRYLYVNGTILDANTVEFVIPKDSFSARELVGWDLLVDTSGPSAQVACSSHKILVEMYDGVTFSDHAPRVSKRSQLPYYNIDARTEFVLTIDGLVIGSDKNVFVKYWDENGVDLELSTSGRFVEHQGKTVVASYTPLIPKPIDWTLYCDNPEEPVPSPTCAWNITALAAVTIDGGLTFSNNLTFTFGYERPFRIAFLYVGAVNDFGWTHQFDVARVSLQAEYGAEIDVKTYYEFVKEGDYEPRQANKGATIATNTEVPQFWDDGTENRYHQAFELMKRFCDEDYDLVVAASTGLMAQSVDVSNDYLGCQYKGNGTTPSDGKHDTFFINTGFKTTPRLSTAFAKIYQVRYLTGIVAGYELKKRQAIAEKNNEVNKEFCVGFVASYPVPQVTRGINAFTIGCGEVFPECVVKVAWMGTWNHEQLETHAAAYMWNIAKCEVITQHSVTTKPQMYYSDKGGVGIGYNSDAKSLVGDSVLTSSILQWHPIIKYFIEQISLGEWIPEDRVPGGPSNQEQVWLGIDQAAAKLAPYFSPKVPQDVQDFVIRKYAAIAKNFGSEAFHGIFCGDAVKRRWIFKRNATTGERLKGCGGQPIWERLEESTHTLSEHFWDATGQRLSPNDPIKSSDCLYGVNFPGQALLQSSFPSPFDETLAFNDFLVEGVELFDHGSTSYGTVLSEETHQCSSSYGSLGDRFFVEPKSYPKCDGTQWELGEGDCDLETGRAIIDYRWVVDPVTGFENFCGNVKDVAGVYSIVADLPKHRDKNGDLSYVDCAPPSKSLDTLPITLGTLAAGLVLVLILYRIGKKHANTTHSLLEFLVSPVAAISYNFCILAGGTITSIIACVNLATANDPVFISLIVPYVTVVSLQSIVSFWALGRMFKQITLNIRALTTKERRKSLENAADKAQFKEYLEKELEEIRKQRYQALVKILLLFIRDLPGVCMNFLLISTKLEVLKSPSFSIAVTLGLIITIVGTTKIPLYITLRHEVQVIKCMIASHGLIDGDADGIDDQQKQRILSTAATSNRTRMSMVQSRKAAAASAAKVVPSEQ